MIGILAMSLVTGMSARAGERFSDPATGFNLELPDGFAIKNRRNDANHDVLVDIVSLNGEPPVAGTSAAVCAAGFKQGPPGFKPSLEELNRPSAMEYMATESRRLLANSGLDVQSVEKIDRSDLAGFEFTMIPGNGPDHRNIRIYMAIMDRPDGRTDVVCATTRAALPSALGVFRTIRDGVGLSAR